MNLKIIDIDNITDEMAEAATRASVHFGLKTQICNALHAAPTLNKAIVDLDGVELPPFATKKLNQWTGDDHKNLLEAIVKIPATLALVKQQEAEIARLREALKPFARCVFNDNGDMTISPVSNTRPYIDAYFALTAAALGETNVK